MKASAVQYYHHKEKLELESGEVLPRFTLAYHTYGQLNAAKDNTVWIVHALTADSNAADWWTGVVGPGLAIDTDQYFVVCASPIGGHYGSTNPLSTDLRSGLPYYDRFPTVTHRDAVQCFVHLAKSLDIPSIHTLIGPSLGGQQALEWAIVRPAMIHNLVLIATNAVHSPYGIAFNESQRMAIETDPTWLSPQPDAGLAGLKVARSIALISYRTKLGYDQTQSRQSGQIDGFRASSYQRYQGQKLASRYSAYAYYLLTKMMDSHDVGRGRHSVAAALGTISARTTIVGIDSDILFPLAEQQFLADHIPGSTFRTISSDFGHDGFLTEAGEMSAILRTAIAKGSYASAIG